MIEFKNVSKVYENGSTALDNVCITINDGEFVLICGHSGAGKSTLFKLLTHEVTPDSGLVIVDEFDVTKLKSGQEQLVRNQEFLSQHIVALENELIPKVTALFDGYTLRGEQIDNLKAHFDARLDDYQEDVSYLISKTGKQEKQILSMSRQVKHILP